MLRLGKLALLLLCVLLAAESAVDAQRRIPVRRRPATEGGSPPTSSNETIAITSPNPPAHSTTDGNIPLSGTATAGITSVEWANAATSESGSAVLTSGLWNVSTATPSVRFQDTFTEAGSVNLSSHTPDTGTSWTYIANTTSTTAIAYGSWDDGRMAANGSAGQVVIVQANPSTPIVGTTYHWTVPTTSSFSGNSGSSAGLVFGIVDASNYCVVDLISGSAIVAKVVSGVATTLATSTAVPPGPSQIWVVERSGNDFVVKQSGVSRAAFTEAACAGSNNVGLGWGAIRPGSGKSPQTVGRFDDVVLTDPSAGTSGIALNVGTNVITVTGYEADMTPHAQVITVTRTGADTTAPSVAFSTPTPRPYSTTTAALTVAGVGDDNLGVSTLVLTCATCTPTSLNATISSAGGTAVTWTGDLTLATGANTITATATDAASNATAVSFTATLSTGADTTAPTVTITTPNGSGSSTETSTPRPLAGTATDDVQVASVTWSGTTCGGGTATGTTAWSISVPFSAPGACTVTVTATDSSGNTGTATHTFTYAPPLTITTVSPLQPAPQSSAYAGAQLAATGGTSPYTWDNNAGGSSLGGGACTGGSISSAGAITGTFTTAGTCTFTARVTDNVAATATKSFSLVVGAVSLGGTNHSYFDTLCARSDVFKCETLRDNAKVTLGTPGNFLTRGSGVDRWSYDPVNDTFPNKQDGTKFQLIAFDDPSTSGLVSGVDASTTSLCFDNSTDVTNGFALKIDSEIVVINGAGQPKCPVQVLRGQYGTTAASHSAGALVYEHRGTLSVGKWLVIPTATSTGSSYFYAFDYYAGWTGTQWADGWKWLNWTNAGGGIEWEPNFMSAYANGSVSVACGTAPSLTFNDTVDAGIVFPPRYYSMPLTPLTKTDGVQGSCPASNGFLIKANTWTRVFAQITFRAETDLTHDAGFTLASSIDTSTVTTQIPVRQGGVDVLVDFPNTSTVVVNGTFISGAPQFSARRSDMDGRFSVGTRRIKIGSEIMTVLQESSWTSTTQRTLLVTRATDSTSIASHAASDVVYMSVDTVSLWLADETRDPVAIQVDMPHYFQGRRSLNFGLEQNTSTDRVPAERATAGLPDLTGYVRDFIMLGKTGEPDAGWAALRTRPTVGGN